jgi:hypothetical protein
MTIMNSTEHPDLEQLLDYQQQPDADRFREVSLHLASCRDCRQQLNTALQLKRLYPMLSQVPIREDQQQRVEQFLFTDMPQGAQAELRNQIVNDPAMLRSALHALVAKSESESQQAPSVVPDSPPANPRSQSMRPGWMERLSDWLGWQSNLWVTASVSILISAGLVYMMMQNVSQTTFGSQSGAITISAYQDDNRVHFAPRESAPGIGFFNSARHSTRLYGNLSIKKATNGGLELQWPAVADASGYELKVYRYQAGEKHLVDRVSTTQTHAIVDVQAQPQAVRYEWVLSGLTNDDQSFMTSGGFVLHTNSR